MAYTSSTHRELRSQLHLKGGVEAQTLAGALTLTEFSAQYLALDPGGANRDVTLPAEEQHDGLFFAFYNAADASENLVVKNDGGSTIATVARGQSTIVACDGTAWRVVSALYSSTTDFGGTGLATDVIAESTPAAGVTIDGLLIKDDSVRPDAITDPGNAGAIPVTKSGYCPLVTAGAETRTLAAPSFIGQQLQLHLKTDGGDCVVTCATTVNQTGNNTITLNDAGDCLTLVAKESGGNIRWSVVHNDGAALSTV